MEVFISFSRDHSRTAEKIAVKLRAVGLEVFFDRDSLEAGKGFDVAIRKTLETCDLFIFLISPQSIAKGAYALTELRYIQERWPNGEGHVFPVMVSGTPEEKIPAYLLESLTIFRPDGDCAVEVANKVCEILDELTDEEVTDEAHNPVAHWMDVLIDMLSQRRRLAPDDSDLDVYSRRIDQLVKDIRERFSPKEGMTVAGAILENVVGSGNFGTVWKATDIETKEKVAVKIFRLERLTEGQMLARFSRSVRAMRILSEEKRKSRASYTRGQIVRFYRADETRLAFAMEYIGGGNLEDVERLGWNLDRKLDVVISVCEAVAYAHGNGVIHRDIKPANIVLSVKQKPVLTDFDISDIKWATSLSTTIEGGLGTPVFAAPEQLISADDADELADIYSLGRLLYYLLLERSPGYELEKDPELRNIRNQPLGLVAIVRKATQYDRTKRFGSVDELLKALEKCRTGTAAIQARALNFQRSMKRNWHVGIILTLIVGFSIGFAIYQADVARTQARAAKSEKSAREDAVRAKETLTVTNEQLQSTNEKLLQAEAAVSQLMKEQKKYTQSEEELEELQEQLKKTPEGSKAYKKLSQKLEALQQSLASQKGRIDQLADKAQKLKDEARKARVTKSDNNKPKNNIKRTLRCDGGDCTRTGLCKVARGKCVATLKSCLEADVCKELGQCVEENGVCIATTETCSASRLCSDEQRCVAFRGKCKSAIETAFAQGVDLFNAEEYKMAADKFREVYAAKPNWRLFYNIGQCEAAGKRYEFALIAFERYLAEGGDSISSDSSSDRQRYVEKEVARLRYYVGYVKVTAPDDTVIKVDGVTRGQMPLPGPILVGMAIEHTISGELNGQQLAKKKFVVRGGQTMTINLESKPEASSM